MSSADFFLFLYSLIYCLRPSPFVLNEKNRKLIGFQQGKRKRFRCLLKHDPYVLEHILIMSSVLVVKTSLTNLCVFPLRVCMSWSKSLNCCHSFYGSISSSYLSFLFRYASSSLTTHCHFPRFTIISLAMDISIASRTHQ